MRRQLNINIWLHWTGEERDIWRTSTRLCVYRSIVSDRIQNKTRCSTPHCLRCLLLHAEEMRAINLSSPAPSETTSLHDTPTLVWLGEDLNDTRFCCRRRLDVLAALARVYYPDDFKCEKPINHTPTPTSHNLHCHRHRPLFQFKKNMFCFCFFFQIRSGQCLFFSF